MKRFQKIATGVLYALLCGVLMGCNETLRDRYDKWMSELDCPIILIGKTEKATHYAAITVRDGSGRVRTFQKCVGGLMDNCSSFPNSRADSRMIGDTLKPCN